VKPLSIEDLLTFYVSRASLNSQIPVQKFVGCAKIMSTSYESAKSVWPNGVFPIQVDIKVLSNNSCQILGLIERMKFIKNKKHWGGAFMGSLRTIPREDFVLIQETMTDAG